MGCDFFVDENFNVFLLEINKCPGLGENSPIVNMLLPRMIDDSIKLTVDELFNTIYKEIESRFEFKNYSNSENMWQFIFNFKDKNVILNP